MSGYHSIWKFKSCLSSLSNLKNLKKLNNNLGKEINSICTNLKNTPNSQGFYERIKEFNEVISKEFSKVASSARTSQREVFNVINDNVANCTKKIFEKCKPLSSLPDTLEEKKWQYKRKHLRTKHIRKEAERLCQYLSKHQNYGNGLAVGAAGLSLTEVPQSLLKNPAAENQAVSTFNIAENSSMLMEAAEKDLYAFKLPPNSVLDRDTSVNLSMSEFSSTEPATILDKNIEYFVVKTGKYAKGTGTTSTETISIPLNDNDAIPEPPPIPDIAAEALNQLNALGEPTFASMGLGGWTPVGMVQQCMEYLHVTLGIDWWLAIVLGTLVIRICMFPLVILSQRNAAKMNNNMPQMQLLQLKMTEARQTGDAINAARYSQEMMIFMKEKGLNPFKNMIVPLAQAPIFVSFFMGLRQMANVPVESLTHGGLFWFMDLTLPDQYFLLPIITSATLWLTIEIGTDTAKLSAQNMGMMKYALRAIPIVVLPFTINFPGVILCYWVSSNFISLLQVAFLRIPKVRTYFNIDQLVTHNPENLPVKPKGFTEGLKDSWTNVKITKQLEDRRRLDEIQFQRAGKGPIQKTYKYDPTKQPASDSVAKTPISAKKR